ncbi:dihydroxyacetone kinase subunit DhaK [Stomatohabitans albus]|uniref:dihydroxyacetone kinase subunit DhaK n=1 Tax=Stomatohabitans albus TaxID=3110766 RepID=UPI00300D8A39
MKKLINDPREVVAEALEGFALAFPSLVTVHNDPVWVGRANPAPEGRVALVSGGGSGHEPLHAGFVGEGMLDAAVPGAVFTSPTPDAIEAATRGVDHGAGVVHIVKNYTGDVLNFETAAELCAADGISVQQVLVNDDVSVEDSTWTAGRRGVAGTVVVEKIAGAACARGDDIDTVVRIAQEVVANTKSMGLALSACTVPHAGKPSFDLRDDEVEMGVGIHGEPGRATVSMATADELTAQLVDPLLAELPDSGEVLVLVNGMGATPESELFIVYRAVRHRLAQTNLTVERSLVGNYTTSLDMAGVSVTITALTAEMKQLWDAPVITPSLIWKDSSPRKDV